MKYLFFLLLASAFAYLIYRRMYYVRQKRFWNQLANYNKLYVMCKDIIEDDSHIGGLLKLRLKEGGYYFSNAKDVRQFLVRMGYAIEEEKIVNDISIDEYYFMQQEYTVFLEAFANVRKASLTKNEDILEH